MRKINKNSRRGIVNLFADFILQKLGKTTKTLIQINLYKNFIVINGVTDSTENLDIDLIKKEFFDQNKELCENISVDSNIGTLNLLTLETEFFKNNCFRYNLNLYNTERPIYNKNSINFYFNEFVDSVEWKNELFLEIPHNAILPKENYKFSPLVYSSEFPYGYSLNLGRSLIYYAEYISHNVFNTLSVEHMKLLITNQKKLDGDQIIKIESKSLYPQEKIESLILDNFDFDLDKFSKKFDEYDFCEEIKNVSSEKPWLIKDIVVQDLIII
jgi:hypothetical protein